MGPQGNSSTRRAGFRLRITGFALLLLTVTMAVATALTYHLSKKALERHLGAELLGIVNSAAPAVDGDLIPLIFRDEDGRLSGVEEFEAIRGLLTSIRNANGLESRGSPLYLMRRTEADESGDLEFVVMTDPDPNGNYFTGNRYRSRPHNRKALEGVATATGIYEDNEGIWISAAAPVRNGSGRVVAVLQADRPVNFFYAEARNQAVALMVVALGGLAIGTLLASWFARSLSVPVAELVAATQTIAKGRLDHRVRLNRNDELGDLGDSINRMAAQLTAAREELLERQAELREATAQAQAASRAKSAFLATVSHELRTPLNAIAGFTDLLMEGAITPEQRRYSATVRSNADHLLRIINEILDFSKIEAGKLTLDELEFAPDWLMQTAVDLMMPAAAKKGLRIYVWMEESVPDAVRGDPVRLRQVLVNLLANAVKFTSEGEIVLRVRANSAAGSRIELRCEVQDTGIGISQEAQARLFQPFVQANASAATRYGGTGLGLVVCQRLTGLMDGRIGVESEEGGGSTFWFTVWLEAVSQGVSSILAPERLAGGRILVAGDSECSDRLVRCASTWGMRGEAAESEAQALELLGRAVETGDRFKAVIVSGGTGSITLARAMRGRSELAETPVIAITAQEDRLVRARLAATGVESILLHPAHRRHLLEALANALPAPAPEIALPPAPVTCRTASGVRILVAEDNDANLELITRVLERLGHQVDSARNGLEVLEAVRVRDYELILMDCRMPEMDGYEATREIRRREALYLVGQPRHTYIVALTANAMSGDREKCLEAGMDDYLSKPVEKTALSHILNRYLRVEETPQPV
ncbi:MAG: response regulator [Bryobacteraceae bacterium]|nr:response regulator [Bryobacteraceae bacterium]